MERLFLIFRKNLKFSFGIKAIMISRFVRCQFCKISPDTFVEDILMNVTFSLDQYLFLFSFWQRNTHLVERLLLIFRKNLKFSFGIKAIINRFIRFRFRKINTFVRDIRTETLHFLSTNVLLFSCIFLLAEKRLSCEKNRVFLIFQKSLKCTFSFYIKATISRSTRCSKM